MSAEITASNNNLASASSYINFKSWVKFDGTFTKQEKVTSYESKNKNMVNVHIFNEINLWSTAEGAAFASRKSLLGAVKLIKNVDPVKYKYSDYSFKDKSNKLISFHLDYDKLLENHKSHLE